MQPPPSLGHVPNRTVRTGENMLCTEGALRQDLPDRRRYITLYCRSWHCDVCAPRRKRQVIREALAGKPRTFVTLTSRRVPRKDADSAARELKRAWCIVRRSAQRRERREKHPYFAVFEKTKHGWPHLHILTRSRWIDQRWLSDEMERLIGAPVVHVRRIRGRRKAAYYVAKYLGKDPTAFQGCKRYWRTLDWHKLRSTPNENERVPSETWHVVPHSLHQLEHLFESNGWTWWREEDALVVLHEHPRRRRRRRIKEAAFP